MFKIGIQRHFTCFVAESTETTTWYNKWTKEGNRACKTQKALPTTKVSRQYPSRKAI